MSFRAPRLRGLSRGSHTNWRGFQPTSSTVDTFLECESRPSRVRAAQEVSPRLLVVALLSVLVGAGAAAAADATWKTHQDQACGIELKYPAAYALEPSGARDFCSLSLRIGVREARGLRMLFSMEVREMQSAEREAVAR